ncbi:MAG: polysaccharide export protein [Kiloniellales bacterium]|nr:polysaccharide export protein [Kiloniellales bacterium]
MRIKGFYSNAAVALVGAAMLLGACSSKEDLPQAEFDTSEPPFYQIGAGDSLTIFIWRNPELTTGVSVRPDGRISVPLIEDLYVEGKNPTELARVIEEEIGQFVQDPIVTVIVTGFVGTFPQQVRVIGEASRPLSLPYRANMTALDALIAFGGLTDFADGNDTTLVRIVDGEQKEYRVRLDDLAKDGDITANVALKPGDILIIPESFF